MCVLIEAVQHQLSGIEGNAVKMNEAPATG